MQKIYENKFYESLENIFVGANIEGESGYINLLKIKSAYYKIILEKFKEDVDNDPIITDSFKEEFFDRLYSFFEKYFSESGSVYFVKTANWQRVYEQVYTDNKDVVLFWKTHMLYYVKSDILFQSIDVTVTDEEETNQDYNFFFDVGNLQNKQNNEKKQIIFTFREIKEEFSDIDVVKGNKSKKVYVFDVSYSEKGTKTKLDEIVKQTKISEKILEKAFKIFKKQSEVDFFINKNAKKFLTEQLDLYLHQILLAEENKFDQKRLDQLKTIKTFALKIINFIAQFEDELVRVWNKPKFVLNSNYVITLDKLSEEIISKIKKHINLPQQIQEWIELGIVDNDFTFDQIQNKDLLQSKNEKYKFLPIDTKYFKDLELEILGLFDDLDNSLDGWLIKSENYQALNTILPKFREKVQTIYIDPPFNLDSSDQFLYRTNYKDANWATLLENRLRIAREWLNEKGSIFVRCDYNGNWIVRCLMDDILGKENFRNEINIKRMSKLAGSINFDIANDSLFLFSKSSNIKINKLNRNRICRYCKQKKEPEWVPLEAPGDSKNDKIIINGRVFISRKNSHWTFKQEIIDELYSKGILRINENRTYLNKYNERVYGLPEYLQYPYQELDSDWTDIPGYTNIWNFQTENSEKLLMRVIASTSNQKNFILDFFLGSGTTTAVAHKLGRKWIGVETGEHFYSVVLPRMKKVLFYDKSGISKEKDVKENYNENKAGGFFKYYELEQYEETLRNMKYKDNTPNSIFDEKKAFEQYIFFADQKFAHILEVNKDSLEIDFDKLYPNIDFAETISNLLGLPIKKVKKDTVILENEQNEKEIKTDYKNMTDDEKVQFLQILRPLLWWGE